MEFLQDNTEVGKLSCGTAIQRQPSILNWPGDRAKPTVFCHVDEAEETVMWSGYSVQQRIANSTEVDFVVGPYFLLFFYPFF